MENQDIKVKIFKITTPIIFYEENQQRNILTNFFDFQRINFSLLSIERNELIDRKKTYEWKGKNPKTMWLHSYNSSYSDEYAIGKLHTVSHGLEALNYDINQLVERSRLGKDEGILGTSLFLIDKRSGYLYMTEDTNFIANKYNTNLYFNSEKELNKLFIEKFRDSNDVADIDGRQNLFQLGLLKPLPLLDQLKKMKSVKQIELYPSNIRSNSDTNSNGLLYDLKDDLSSYLEGAFRAKVQLNGFENELTAEALESLIEYLSESEKYEEYKFEAVNEDNVRRVFSSDSMTRDFIITCDTTVEGWPKEDEFYDIVSERINDDEHLNIDREGHHQVNQVDAEKIIESLGDEESGESEKGEKSS